MNKIICIGFSAGGLGPFRSIVSSLESTMPASILAVGHRSGQEPYYLPEILNRPGGMPAKIVEDGDKIECGHIYVARPGFHFLISPAGEAVLGLGPKVDGFRPSISELFRSAAEHFKEQVIGIILSGSLYDGVKGLLDVKRCGGITIVQDLKEAEFPWMPMAALRSDGHIEHVLRAKEIEAFLKTNL